MHGKVNLVFFRILFVSMVLITFKLVQHTTHKLTAMMIICLRYTIDRYTLQYMQRMYL